MTNKPSASSELVTFYVFLGIAATLLGGLFVYLAAPIVGLGDINYVACLGLFIWMRAFVGSIAVTYKTAEYTGENTWTAIILLGVSTGLLYLFWWLGMFPLGAG